jgi:hypothetical protein
MISVSPTAAGRNADVRPIRRGRSPSLRLGLIDKLDLCRSAKRAWHRLPSRARRADFAWRGRRFVATASGLGVHVRDTEGRQIAAMLW